MREIHQMYITFYGRPADPAGIAYWIQQAGARGMDWVREAFTRSQEFDQLHASKSTTQLFNDWFEQAYGRPATTEEVQDLGQQLDEGASHGQLLGQILAHAEERPDEEAVLNNRVLVAERFTQRLEEAGASFTLDDIPASRGLLTAISNASPNAQQVLERVLNMQIEKAISDMLERERPEDEENGVITSLQAAAELGVITFDLLQLDMESGEDILFSLMLNESAISGSEEELGESLFRFTADQSLADADALGAALTESWNELVSKVMDWQELSLDQFIFSYQDSTFSITAVDDQQVTLTGLNFSATLEISL